MLVVCLCLRRTQLIKGEIARHQLSIDEFRASVDICDSSATDAVHDRLNIVQMKSNEARNQAEEILTGFEETLQMVGGDMFNVFLFFDCPTLF